MTTAVAPSRPSEAVQRFRSSLRHIASSVFQPSPDVTLSEWADDNWVLSREAGAVEPGPFRTDRVPYLREIMDCISDPGIPRVVWMKASQVGASEVGHIWLAYTANLMPAPFLILYPTEMALKNWATMKLDPAVAANESLRSKLVEVGGRRDQRNTMTRRKFPGGGLVALAAKSTAQLRSLTAFYAIAEEVDEYDETVRRQGDPLKLLERAIRNAFRAGGKIYIPSTPTDDGFSNVQRQHDAGDRRKYFVPCPDCNGMQRLYWRDEQGRYRIICDRDEHDHFILESAQYLCEHCGVLIPESKKDSMLAAGEWRAELPKNPYPSFQLGSQYSPFVSWAQMMGEFVQARRSEHTLKPFINLWVGEPFESKAESVPTHMLSARQEDYGEGVDVPNGVGVVTAGVDVQGDRLEVFPWGWGHLEEAWCIGWEQLDGDPGQDAVWAQLWQRLTTPYRHQNGAEVRIAAMAIDAGHQPDRVHRFVDAARARGLVVIPTIGRGGRGRPLLQSPAPQKWKKTRRQLRPNYVVHVDAGKDILLSRLRVQTPGPQYMHFPAGLDPTYFDQLTAERLVMVYKAGRPAREWKLLPERRNEALDGTIYAMAALFHLGPRVIGKLGELAEQLKTSGPGSAGPVRPSAGQKYGLISETEW